jgi:cytochrome P450
MDGLAASGWLARIRSDPRGRRARHSRYAVLDHESVSFFLHSGSVTSIGGVLEELLDLRQGLLAEQLRNNVLFLGDDDHRRVRKVVNPAFTPPATDRLRARMRQFLADLWEQIGAERECEFVEAFARPYASLVIAAVLDAPLEDAPRLQHWSNLIQRQFDPTAVRRQRAEIEQALTECYEYMNELLAARNSSGGEDLVSALSRASADGHLSREELAHVAVNVPVAGIDTVQAQLAHGMRLFCDHPDQWELLHANPELAPRAVEEIVRFGTAVPFIGRVLTEDVQHRGVLFPGGTVVYLALVTAGRGRRPDGFDITAERDNARPLGFGAGTHHCLGANLGRGELQEALRFLAPRMPRLEFAGEPEYASVQGIYGLARLPLRWA